MATKKTEALTEVIDLPQFPGIEMVDDNLVSEAVAELNEIYAKKGVEATCAVGEYVLEKFFEGNMDNFNEWGGKHRTFGQLVELAQDRENSPLYISASGLWYSVRILEQVKALPEGIAMALPSTHHRMLVPVKNIKLKKKLAKDAVSKRMTSREFQEEVRAVREEERTSEERGFSSGRPSLPNFAKGLKQVIKGIDAATSERVTKSSFEAYDAKQAQKLLKDVDKSLDKLIKLKGNIEKQIVNLSE